MPNENKYQLLNIQQLFLFFSTVLLTVTKILIILALIAIAAFAGYQLLLESPSNQNDSFSEPIDVRSRTGDTDQNQQGETLVVVHSFEDGKHMYTGSVVLPTPCHKLSTEALVAEQAGVDGIVFHLREDRRHINERDVRLLRELVTTKLDFEICFP